MIKPRWWDCDEHGNAWEGIATKLGRELRIDGGIALQNLKSLYPPAVCKDLLDTPGGKRFLLAMFGTWFRGNAVGSLLLGHDLEWWPNWGMDSELLGRLREPTQYSSARFEVGVRSGLERLGLSVYRPERHQECGPAQTPDFVLFDTFLKTKVALELKATSASILDQRIDELRNALSTAYWNGSRGIPLEHAVHLRPSDDLIRWATEAGAQQVARDCCDRVYSALFDFFRECGKGLAPGQTHAVTHAGEVLVGECPVENMGEIGVVSVETSDLTRSALRALRSIRDCAGHFSQFPKALRVGVITMSAYTAHPRPLRDEICRLMRARPESVPRQIDVAVMFAGHNLRGPWQREAFALDLTGVGEEALRAPWFFGITNWREYSFIVDDEREVLVA